MKKYAYIGTLLVVASMAANAASVVPYEETFESYASGFEIPGTDGWAADPFAAVVSTDASSISALNSYSETCGYPAGGASHNKVLELAGTVTNSLSGADQMVWVDFMLQAGTLESVDASLLGTAHLATYFNAAGHPMVYHYDSGASSNVWVEISGTVKFGWVRLTIGLDYQYAYFQIKIDGTPLTSASAFVNSDGSGGSGGDWFKMPGTPSQVSQILFDGNGADMDDLVVTKQNPFLPIISSLEYVFSDVVKMVIDFPVGNGMILPADFSPIRSLDLDGGSWDNSIGHSTNGVAPWIDTDLDYSTSSGSSREIYLQAAEPAAFFSLENN